MADDSASYEVRFMPWAGLSEEISIGPVRLQPWSPASVTDKSIADHLTQYFRCYVNNYGKPVDSIAVVTVGDFGFEPLPNYEAWQARAAIDALIFASICPTVNAAVRSNNFSLAPPTSDRYQLICQQFRPGTDTIAVCVGFNTSICHIGKARFSQPWGLGGSLTFPDSELLAALGVLLSSDHLVDARERLFRSLEWFRLAHTEGDNTSELTKLVLQSTAFEVLFALDERRKTKQFIEAVERRISTQKTRRNTRLDYKNKQCDRSLPGWWARDFYNLRSRIVHGDPIDYAAIQYSGWITHGIVADLVYWQCITRELYELKCMGDSIREHAKEWDAVFPNEEPGIAEPLLAEWFLDFKRYQRVLGWLPQATAQ